LVFVSLSLVNMGTQIPLQAGIDDDIKMKPSVEMIEFAESPTSLLKSRFDELSLWRTLWLFRTSALYCVAVYTGYLCEGFELTAGGSIIANAGFIAQFGTQGGTGVYKLNTSWVSAWGAVLNVGQMITFTYIAWVNDRFGRKVAFYLAFLWLVAGLLFLNFAKTPVVWMLGKLCNGAGIGIIQVTAQVYVMEIVPNRIRGGLEAFSAVWQGIGAIIINLMMQQINKKYPHDYILAMRVVWAPIGLIIFCWAIIPESPWFHVKRGNKEGAIKSLRQLYGNVPGFDFEEEYGIIYNTIQHERATLNDRPRVKDVFRGTNLKRTFTVVLLAMASQFLGTTIISTYSTYFFAIAGLKDPFLGSLILSCVGLIAVIFWCFTTDRLGRRIFVNVAETTVVLLLFCVGAIYYAGATTGNVSAGTALLVLCCFWNFGYSIISKAYYLFSAEIPTAVLRVKTVPITYYANSILGLALTFAVPPMLVKLNLRTTFVFGAFSVPICICMWIFLPETKGRSSAEIDELYERRIPPSKWSTTTTEAETQMHAIVAVKGGVDV